MKKVVKKNFEIALRHGGIFEICKGLTINVEEIECYDFSIHYQSPVFVPVEDFDELDGDIRYSNGKTMRYLFKGYKDVTNYVE